MIEDKPRNQWSKLNDTQVVEAMLMNTDSEYWETCREFIRCFIEKQFSNLLPYLKDEAVQETTLAVHRGLSAFRHQSKFTTWLASIARHRAIDGLRRQADITQWEVHSENLPEGYEDGTEGSAINMTRTPEEIALTCERIRETFAALEEFLQMHAKSDRNKQILQMVLLDGRDYEETAQILGINAPVVGYVARSARDYLHQKLSHKPEADE
ncbi:MAG: hypothetical protein NVSMB49_27490 [Ktedonobacteraceae bacterium]